MNKKLALCMIVKNEGQHLSKCLSSVKGVVDEIIVVDTGSNDNTIPLAESFHANIFRFDWISDFSAARNFGLSVCNSDLILYLDADETLDPVSVQEINKIKLSQSLAAYYCTVRSLDSINSRDNSMRYVRLFPNLPGIKFSGKVHEQIVPSLKEGKVNILSSDILINHFGYNVSADEKKNKANRNLTCFYKNSLVITRRITHFN